MLQESESLGLVAMEAGVLKRAIMNKGKRKFNENNENTPGGRKGRRKKLKYEKIEEDWGLGMGELDQIEQIEIAKTRFLASGTGHCMFGENKKQRTIRVWSETELWIRKMVRMLVEAASAPRASHKDEMKLVSHLVDSPLQDLKDGNQPKEINKCKKKAGGQRLKFDNPIKELFIRKIIIDLIKK